MEFTISAQHTELTPALEQAVKEKFSRFDHHTHADDQPIESVRAHIILRIDSGAHVVEAVITGLGNKPLVAKTEHKDMYAAINEASRVVDRQWRKQITAQLATRRKESIRRTP